MTQATDILTEKIADGYRVTPHATRFEREKVTLKRGAGGFLLNVENGQCETGIGMMNREQVVAIMLMMAAVLRDHPGVE